MAGFRLVGRSEKWGIVMINDNEGMVYSTKNSPFQNIENTIINYVVTKTFLLSSLRPQYIYMKRPKAIKIRPMLAGLMFHVKHYHNHFPELYDLQYDILSKWFHECGGTDCGKALLRRGSGENSQVRN